MHTRRLEHRLTIVRVIAPLVDTMRAVVVHWQRAVRGRDLTMFGWQVYALLPGQRSGYWAQVLRARARHATFRRAAEDAYDTAISVGHHPARSAHYARACAAYSTAHRADLAAFDAQPYPTAPSDRNTDPAPRSG